MGNKFLSLDGSDLSHCVSSSYCQAAILGEEGWRGVLAIIGVEGMRHLLANCIVLIPIEGVQKARRLIQVTQSVSHSSG